MSTILDADLRQVAGLAREHQSKLEALKVALADERARAECPCCRTLIGRILEAIQ